MYQCINVSNDWYIDTSIDRCTWCIDVLTRQHIDVSNNRCIDASIDQYIWFVNLFVYVDKYIQSMRQCCMGSLMDAPINWCVDRFIDVLTNGIVTLIDVLMNQFINACTHRSTYSNDASMILISTLVHQSMYQYIDTLIHRWYIGTSMHQYINWSMLYQ